nr:hypothetical protein BaRGS_008375 [Batillaria attramentaria]
MPFTIVEHSDSTVEGDDSSDENRDHMRQLVIGLQLPDSQSVEVLVHRTVGSHSDQEEQGAAGGGKEGGGTCEPSIILTDVQEVTNEDGQTTFVTHIYAKQLDDKGHVDASSDGSEDEDESDSDCQRKDKDQPPIAAGFDVCKTGVLLQDCVVLNGNESQDHVGDSDGVSLTSSQSLDELKLGEGGLVVEVLT